MRNALFALFLIATTAYGATTDFVLRDARGTDRAATFVAPDHEVRGGVLFLHWLGEPPKNNRTEFVEDATTLASSGIASLLVDLPWSEETWWQSRVLQNDLPFSKSEVRSIAMALDELERRLPKGTPVAIVGHDFGAMYGSLVASTDHRVGAMVVMTAIPRFSDWFLLGKKLDDGARNAYVETMKEFNTATALSRRDDLPLLFQFARNDRYVSTAQADELFAAARGPKERHEYDVSHRMDDAASRSDRIGWLLRWFDGKRETTQPAIARVWHGRTTDAKAAEYYEYLNANGIDKIRQIKGNMGVDVFTRSDHGVTEFLVISYWPSLDAIRAYAGPDIEKTHNLPRDAEFLIDMEPTVKHYVIRRSER